MKNRNLWFLVIVAIVIGFVLYKEDIEDNGRVYSSKTNLCRHFAQSYLRTINKTENISSEQNSEQWTMAIDVETELYELCLIDLDKESLKNYKHKALEKYQK